MHYLGIQTILLELEATSWLYADGGWSGLRDDHLHEAEAAGAAGMLGMLGLAVCSGNEQSVVSGCSCVACLLRALSCSVANCCPCFVGFVGAVDVGKLRGDRGRLVDVTHPSRWAELLVVSVRQLSLLG